MVAYRNPNKGGNKNAKAKRRGRPDQVRNLRFDRWQIIGFGKGKQG